MSRLDLHFGFFLVELEGRRKGRNESKEKWLARGQSEAEDDEDLRDRSGGRVRE